MAFSHGQHSHQLNAADRIKFQPSKLGRPSANCRCAETNNPLLCPNRLSDAHGPAPAWSGRFRRCQNLRRWKARCSCRSVLGGYSCGRDRCTFSVVKSSSSNFVPRSSVIRSIFFRSSLFTARFKPRWLVTQRRATPIWFSAWRNVGAEIWP